MHLRFRSGFVVCALVTVGIAPLVGAAACSSSDSAPSAPVDSGVVEASAACGPTVPFGSPIPVPGINGIALQPRLSDDELTAYAYVLNVATGADLVRFNRTAADASFGALTPLAISTPNNDYDPFPTSDGTRLFFHSQVGNSDAGDTTDSGDAGIGNLDIFSATRASASADLEPATSEDALNSPFDDGQVSVTKDGSQLFFASNRSGKFKIYSATQTGGGGGGAYGSPAQVSEIDSNDDVQQAPVISPDGLTLFFASNRAGTKGDLDMWQMTRATVSDPFSSPTILTSLNSIGQDTPGWISPDGCRLYFLVFDEKFHSFYAERAH